MRIADGVRAWLTLPWEKHLLRGIALVAMLAYLVILFLGSRIAILLFVPAVLFGLLSVLGPDSEAPLITLGGCVLFWGSGMRVEDLGSVRTIIAALLLLLFHACLTVTAHGPAPARLARATLVRWGTRTGIVALVTVVVWLAVRGLAVSPLHAPSWGRGLALVLLSLGTVAAVGVITGRVRKADGAARQAGTSAR